MSITLSYRKMLRNWWKLHAEGIADERKLQQAAPLNVQQSVSLPLAVSSSDFAAAILVWRIKPSILSGFRFRCCCVMVFAFDSIAVPLENVDTIFWTISMNYVRTWMDDIQDNSNAENFRIWSRLGMFEVRTSYVIGIDCKKRRLTGRYIFFEARVFEKGVPPFSGVHLDLFKEYLLFTTHDTGFWTFDVILCNL